MVAFIAAFLLLQAAWVPAKAWLGQALLERAWRLTLATGDARPPWPWADTVPVGVLEAPRLALRQVVVAGASGRNLAWAPAALAGSRPGQDQVLSGHRDTHFGFLAQLEAGDLLRLRTRDGVHAYRVSRTEVIDSRAADLVIEAGVHRLTLVTCYPFDAVEAGGPLRYVVTALPAPNGADEVGT